MADTVSYHLERMLPVLEDLEKRGLFNPEEIKEIVKQRREFEYLLKRPSPIQQDFLNYLEFEQNLEALRKLRKKTLMKDLKGDKWKPSLCDYASVSHVLLIYERAVTKFKGDMNMWLQYLEYCRSQAPRKFQKVAIKCLYLHPNVPGLWIYAAAWEFEKNVNVKAARVLMQRGLRMCPRSEKLWIEYFRMELTYIEKLKARKLVLGLDLEKCQNDEKRAKKSKYEADVAKKDAEENYEEHEFKSAVEKEVVDEAISLEDKLSSQLSESIYRNAIAAMPSSLEFRQRFLEVLDNFDFEQKEELEANIHVTIADDFPRNEDSWDWMARRYMASKNLGYSYSFLEGKRRAVEVYEKGLQSIPSVRMYELYTRFFLDILDMDIEDLDSSSSFDPTISSKTQRHDIADDLVKVYQRALAERLISDVLLKEYAEVLLRNGLLNEAVDLSRKLCEDLDTRNFASIWEWRITLEMSQTSSSTSDADSAKTISNLFHGALSCVSLAEAKRLYLMAMEFYTGNEVHSDVVISSLETAMAGGGGGRTGAGLACTAVDWILHSKGIKQARLVYKRFLALPGPSVEFLKHCISLEVRSLGPGSTSEELKVVRKLFNDAVELFGQSDTDLWTTYYYEEMKVGNAEAAKNVYWRAKKALKDPTQFIESHHML